MYLTFHLVLQKHYRYLEAIALEHDDVEEVTDLTEPDVDRISRRAGTLLEEFKELVYPDGYNPEQKPSAKRKVMFSECSHYSVHVFSRVYYLLECLLLLLLNWVINISGC